MLIFFIFGLPTAAPLQLHWTTDGGAKSTLQLHITDDDAESLNFRPPTAARNYSSAPNYPRRR